MNISGESLAAYNKQLENAGNDAYRKANKLGDPRERLELRAINDSIYGITGRYHRLTKKQVIEYGHTIIK